MGLGHNIIYQKYVFITLSSVCNSSLNKNDVITLQEMSVAMHITMPCHPFQEIVSLPIQVAQSRYREETEDPYQERRSGMSKGCWGDTAN